MGVPGSSVILNGSVILYFGIFTFVKLIMSLTGIGGSCEMSSSLCSHVENSKCAGGTCVCPPNTIYVKTANKCLKSKSLI